MMIHHTRWKQSGERCENCARAREPIFPEHSVNSKGELLVMCKHRSHQPVPETWWCQAYYPIVPPDGPQFRVPPKGEANRRATLTAAANEEGR